MRRRTAATPAGSRPREHSGARWEPGAGDRRRRLVAAPPRRRAGVILPATLLALACVSPAASGRWQAPDSAPIKPVRIIPAPRALVDGTAPLPGGVIWVLYGNRSAMRLGRVELSTGATRHSVAVSRTATCIAGSSRGVIALGLARPTTGAVEFLDATTGRRVGSAAVKGPVRALAFGYGGETLYVLNGTAASMAVTRIHTSSFHVARAERVPHDSIGIVPDRSETAVWTLQRSGALEETSLTSGETLAALSTGNPGVAVAASPDGDRIYVLKRTATTMNVSIITSATEDVARLVPVALDSVSLALSPDGRTLYDFVGTPRYGNIQEIALARGGG